MFEQFKMASYNEAVVMGASLLAIKVGALNILTARSRFVHGDLATGRPGGQAWKEDGAMPGWTATFFKCSLCAFGPSPPTERFTGLVANSVENEPFFLALAVAVATLGEPGPWAPTLVKTYVAGRYFHALVYMTEFPEFLMPHKTLIRAQGFLASTFSMLFLAGSQLME